MTARVRVLPIPGRVPGEKDHYVVLDNVDGLTMAMADQLTQLGKRLADNGGGIPLVFRFPVDLPEVDARTARLWAEPTDTEGPSEPDYGTQWERWLGMMARYEEQTAEAAQRVLDDAEDGALTIHVEVPEGYSSADVSRQVTEALRAHGLQGQRI